MSNLETKTVSAACAGRMLGLGKAKTLQLVHSGRLPAKQLLRRPGWFGDAEWNFAFGKSTETAIIAPESPGEAAAFAALRRSGDPDLWLGGALDLRSAHPIAGLFIDAALAPPLLRPLKKRGFAIHVYGASGGGKTAALKTAVAAWRWGLHSPASDLAP